MDVFDVTLWAIGLAPDMAIEKREPLQKHGVKMVAVFRDSQAGIRQMANQDLGPGQCLSWRIHRRAQNLITHRIKPEIHWVPGHCSIP